MRDEYYYFADGRLELVRVRTRWDVDDEAGAPAPSSVDELFIHDDRVIRRSTPVRDVSASRGRLPGPRELMERADRLGGALGSAGSVDDLLDPLAEFPSD